MAKFEKIADWLNQNLDGEGFVQWKANSIGVVLKGGLIDDQFSATVGDGPRSNRPGTPPEIHWDGNDSFGRLVYRMICALDSGKDPAQIGYGKPEKADAAGDEQFEIALELAEGIHENLVYDRMKADDMYEWIMFYNPELA